MRPSGGTPRKRNNKHAASPDGGGAPSGVPSADGWHASTDQQRGRADGGGWDDRPHQPVARRAAPAAQPQPPPAPRQPPAPAPVSILYDPAIVSAVVSSPSRAPADPMLMASSSASHAPLPRALIQAAAEPADRRAGGGAAAPSAAGRGAGRGVARGHGAGRAGASPGRGAAREQPPRAGDEPPPAAAAAAAGARPIAPRAAASSALPPPPAASPLPPHSAAEQPRRPPPPPPQQQQGGERGSRPGKGVLARGAPRGGQPGAATPRVHAAAAAPAEPAPATPAAPAAHAAPAGPRGGGGGGGGGEPRPRSARPIAGAPDGAREAKPPREHKPPREPRPPRAEASTPRSAPPPAARARADAAEPAGPAEPPDSRGRPDSKARQPPAPAAAAAAPRRAAEAEPPRARSREPAAASVDASRTTPAADAAAGADGIGAGPAVDGRRRGGEGRGRCELSADGGRGRGRGERGRGRGEGAAAGGRGRGRGVDADGGARPPRPAAAELAPPAVAPLSAGQRAFELLAARTRKPKLTSNRFDFGDDGDEEEDGDSADDDDGADGAAGGARSQADTEAEGSQMDDDDDDDDDDGDGGDERGSGGAGGAAAGTTAAAGPAAPAAPPATPYVPWGSDASDGAARLRVQTSGFAMSRKGGLHKDNEDRATCLADFNGYATSVLALPADLASPDSPAPFGSAPPAHGFFAVYDGHGGGAMSTHAAAMLHRHLLLADKSDISAPPADADASASASALSPSGCFRNDPAAALAVAFAKTETDLARYYAKSRDPAGTCAVVALLRGGVVWVANAGDSRAQIVTVDGGDVGFELLSVEHRATAPAERKRIEAAGGFIQDNRALGNLIPSRTLGDFAIKAKKQGAVIATPEILRHEVRRQDRYLVLGSDGLYDVLKPKMVAQICASGKHNAQRAAHDLMKAVARKGCTDDTTIVVATLELEV